MLSGASVRYRFYTRWGVTTEELSRIVFSYSVTFWLGLFALGGLSLVVTPLPGGRELPAHQLVTLAGWLLMLVPVAYVAITTRRRQPLRLWRVELPMPSPRIAAAQLALSSHRLGPGRRGPVRAAASRHAVLCRVSRPLFRRDPARDGQSRARRRRGVRRPDGAVAEAVSELGPASPGAGGVSRRVLPHAVVGRLDRARRRRRASATRTGGTGRRRARPAHGAVHAARARDLHVSRRPGAVVLGRDAGVRRHAWRCSAACCLFR